MVWEIKEIDDSSGENGAIILTPNEDFFITGTKKRIKIWDFSKKPQFSLIRKISENGQVNSLAITSDCKYIISGTDSKNPLKLFDFKTGKLIRVFNGIKKNVYSVVLTKDSQKIIASGNRMLGVWDISNENPIHRMKEVHGGAVFCVALSPDEKYILSGSNDGSIKIWDLKEGTELDKLWVKDYPRSIVFTSDGKSFIYGNSKGVVHFLDFDTKSTEFHYGLIGRPLSYRPVRELLLTDDNKYLIGVGGSQVKIYDISNREEWRGLNFSEFDHAYSIALTSNKKYLLACSNQKIKVWHIPLSEKQLLEDKLIEAKDLMEKGELKQSMSELWTIIESAEELGFKKLIKRAEDQKKRCLELSDEKKEEEKEEKINKARDELRETLINIDTLIQQFQYDDALNTLKDIMESAKEYNFKDLLVQIHEKMNEVEKSKEQKALEDTKRAKEREVIETLRKMVKVSNRINMEMVKDALDLDDKTFNKKVIDWADEFGFKIDGNFLVINQDTVDDFINSLDASFEEWGRKETGKIEKI